MCEGTIDGWLGSVMSTLRQTLQAQLAEVLSPAPPVNKPDPPQEGGDSSKPDKPPATASSMGRVERSFTLENCSEVVLLAIQVDLCKKIDKALGQVTSGENKAALQEVYGKLTAILEAAALMLKGAGNGTAGAQAEQDGAELNEQGEGRIPSGDKRTSRNTSASQARPGTGRDLDASSDISSVSRKGEKPDKPEKPATDEMNEGGAGSSKLLLFPSQIQKISNIIALLSHKRELVRRLIDRAQGPDGLKKPSDAFDWRCHPRCRWIEGEQACKLEILDSGFDYGYEYQGTSSRLVLSPTTDRCFLGLAQAVKGKLVGVCAGGPVSGTLFIGVTRDAGVTYVRHGGHAILMNILHEFDTHWRVTKAQLAAFLFLISLHFSVERKPGCAEQIRILIITLSLSMFTILW